MALLITKQDVRERDIKDMYLYRLILENIGKLSLMPLKSENHTIIK